MATAFLLVHLHDKFLVVRNGELRQAEHRLLRFLASHTHHIVVGTDRKKHLFLNGGSLRHLLVHHLERDIVHVKRHVALVLDFCVEIEQVAVYINALQKVLDSETLAADVLHLALVLLMD